MAEKKQNEHPEPNGELRDLDVREEQAEEVKGGRVGGKMHLDDISLGIITDKSLPKP